MEQRGRQQAQSFEREATRVRYLLFLPQDYDPASGRRWPLILFLHGAGERGTDVEQVKRHGLARYLEERDDFPAIVVSPQCPPNGWWSQMPLAELLDEIEARYAVDPDRIYVTGMSMGGFGAWMLAIEYPERFAAIAPICGGGEPLGAARITHLPIWTFHGDRDTVVPLQRSQEMVDALRARGGNVRFTVHPGVEHDSWTQTYNDPALYEWLFSHRRGG